MKEQLYRCVNLILQRVLYQIYYEENAFSSICSFLIVFFHCNKVKNNPQKNSTYNNNKL